MIVVTAPTGNIGSQVIPQLLAAGEQVRVVARHPDKLSPEIRGNVAVVQGSTDDAAVLDNAFAGARALFWLVPFPLNVTDVKEHYLRFNRPAAEAIKARGVQSVVVISGLYGRLLTRSAGTQSPAYAPEAVFADAGAACRALWCASFMENLLQQIPAIRQQGAFFGPARPDLKKPLVATRDIAAMAARLLLDESWTGQGGEAVMGPEDLSQDDMARIMSVVLGTPVRFQQISAEIVKAQFVQAGGSPTVAEWLVEMQTEADDDPHGSVPRSPANTTPTSFRQWCEEVLKPAFER
jgi:uncharacterized protein YbjT (DUF2867 family)